MATRHIIRKKRLLLPQAVEQMPKMGYSKFGVATKTKG
jgi:hypothetical protein